VHVADDVVRRGPLGDPDGLGHHAWVGALSEIGQPGLAQNLGREADFGQRPDRETDGPGKKASGMRPTAQGITDEPR